MAAPLNNQFWKLRTKHGRDKLFGTPEILWEACAEYFEATDERKWIKKDWVGKDAHEVNRETETPYTIAGLCVYLDCGESFWGNFRRADHQDFGWVFARVEAIMRSQKMEGAMVGAFNANIVARELGLTDKSELDSRVITMNVEPTPEEARKIKESLDKSI